MNHLLGRWFTWNVKTCFLWKIFFFYFSENTSLDRLFTWNVKTCFLWKIKKKLECRLLQILLSTLRVNERSAEEFMRSVFNKAYVCNFIHDFLLLFMWFRKPPETILTLKVNHNCSIFSFYLFIYLFIFFEKQAWHFMWSHIKCQPIFTEKQNKQKNVIYSKFYLVHKRSIWDKGFSLSAYKVTSYCRLD